LKAASYPVPGTISDACLIYKYIVTLDPKLNGIEAERVMSDAVLQDSQVIYDTVLQWYFRRTDQAAFARRVDLFDNTSSVQKRLHRALADGLTLKMDHPVNFTRLQDRVLPFNFKVHDIISSSSIKASVVAGIRENLETITAMYHGLNNRNTREVQDDVFVVNFENCIRETVSYFLDTPESFQSIFHLLGLNPESRRSGIRLMAILFSEGKSMYWSLVPEHMRFNDSQQVFEMLSALQAKDLQLALQHLDAIQNIHLLIEIDEVIKNNKLRIFHGYKSPLKKYFTQRLWDYLMGRFTGHQYGAI
jgi:hypothetical protein